MMDLKEVQPEYADSNPKRPTRMQEVLGRFLTVTTAPTKSPRNWSEQIQLYVSGGTKKLYIYDTTNNAWLSVTVS